MIKHIAIYLRVSSAKQDTRSQEPDLSRWAEGQTLPVKWYRDTFTGKTMDRPGFTRLLSAIAAGQVATVAVWRLDRLGRTAAGLTRLFDELRAAGVNLVSLKDGLDLSTPAGRLQANILASVAAYETEVRGERVAAGIAVARARGVVLGRPKGSGSPRSVGPEKRALVRRLRAEGQSATAIARAVGISRQYVYRVLDAEPS